MLKNAGMGAKNNPAPKMASVCKVTGMVMPGMENETCAPAMVSAVKNKTAMPFLREFIYYRFSRTGIGFK